MRENVNVSCECEFVCVCVCQCMGWICPCQDMVVFMLGQERKGQSKSKMVVVCVHLYICIYIDIDRYRDDASQIRSQIISLTTLGDMTEFQGILMKQLCQYNFIGSSMSNNGNMLVFVWMVLVISFSSRRMLVIQILP